MSHTSRGGLALSLLFAAVAWLPAARPPHAEFSFHRDHVLGTSFDLWVHAPSAADAEAAERAALDEIERLRLVLSTYDPASEVCQLNRATGPVAASPEMLEVLKAYETWEARSGGAFSGRVGELVRVWKDGEKADREPDAPTLQRIVDQLKRPGWTIRNGIVTRLTDQPLNLNAIGKGYIIGRALAAIRAKVPSASAALLDIGGDMAAWGSWAIGIQDPFHPEQNADPLAGLRLTDAAVATSGGYQRFTTVGGKRYSHIFDPRTGQPAGGVAGATVVAPDNVTANALATTLCVLSPDDGLKLVANTPGAACLIVAADGTHFRSANLTTFEILQEKKDEPKTDDKKAAKTDPWPEGYRVTIGVELPTVQANRYRRPYVAVWIEDADGKAVRSLTVWGNSNKYLKDLGDWWKFAKADAALVKGVTRATRGPGKYDVVWDGKDDKGKAVGQGTYTVRVEVHREFGKHLRQSGTIACAAEGATVSLEKNEETGTTAVEYGKKK